MASRSLVPSSSASAGRRDRTGLRRTRTDAGGSGPDPHAADLDGGHPSIEITLLGTGSPLADPDRAGPATLVRAGGRASSSTAAGACSCARRRPARRPTSSPRWCSPTSTATTSPTSTTSSPAAGSRPSRPPRCRSSARPGTRRWSTGSSPRSPRHLLPARPPRRPHLGPRSSGGRAPRRRRARRGRRADRRGAHRPPAGAPERGLPRRARRARGGDRRRHRAVRGSRPAVRRAPTRSCTR